MNLHEFFVLHLTTAFILLGILSLAIGSLLNVIIYRLPIMLQSCSTLSAPNLNLFFPRSFCPTCQHMIPAWFNIPLFSYCCLHGRCKHCQTRIPLRYPIVEVVCMLLSLSAAWQFGFTLTLIYALLLIWILICLCVIDLQHQLLPDSLTLSLLWLGLMANTQTLFTPLSNAVWSTVAAYLSLWLVIKLYYLCTGKIGMGNGDFKLYAAFGAWFGFTQLPLILFIASLTGAIFGSIYLKLTGQARTTPIPFGPFLCFAGLVALFFGKSLLLLWIRGFAA